jgi:hypothetical protein
MLVLLLTLTASADPTVAISRMVQQGNFQAATDRCAKLTDAVRINPELREACASAHMSLLGDDGDATQWGELARQWSGTDVAEMAKERAADMALAALSTSATEAQLLRINKAYPGTVAAQKALRQAAGAALAAVIEADEVLKYRAFREKYPDTPQATQALEKEAAAALADVEKYDTPIAWQRLGSHYPQLAQVAGENERAALGRLVAASVKLSLPCAVPTASGPDDIPPPQCNFLPKDAEIHATWSIPEGYTAKVRLVGWDGTQAITLGGLQAKIGPAPYASQFAEVVTASDGTIDEHGWTLIVPVDLKRPPNQNFQGYAVQIRVQGQEVALLPFVVSDAYQDARRGQRGR